MSSLRSSQSSLPPPASSPSPPPPEATSPSSSSFSLPTSLALTASGFLRRFYTDSSIKSNPSSSPPPSSSAVHQSGVVTPPTPHPPPPLPSRRQASPFHPPPLHPLSLNGGNDDTGSASTRLLSRSLAEEIRSLIPPRLQLADEWTLAYSLERDGVSLATLYEKCERFRGGARRGFVVVVKDGSGGLFGAYLTDAPHPSSHYYGTGECFLWRASLLGSTPLLSSLPPPPSSDTTNLARSTTIGDDPDSSSSSLHHHHQRLHPKSSSSSSSTHHSGTSTPAERIRFKAFPYSGVNEYMIFCEPRFLSVGGGDGHYGLWLDDVFEKGVSSTCLTFGNEPLSDEGEKFDIWGVEVWVLGS